MAVTTDLLNGIANMIATMLRYDVFVDGFEVGFDVDGPTAEAADPKIDTVVWKQGTVYGADETGLFQKIMPAHPDRAVTLTAVMQGDDISMPLGQVMVQVRGRGLPNSPTDVDDLLDSIFEVLHGATNLTFGSVTVIQMNRRTSVPMGMDDHKRWERVDQYYLDVDFPPTINRPDAGSW